MQDSYLPRSGSSPRGAQRRSLWSLSSCSFGVGFVFLLCTACSASVTQGTDDDGSDAEAIAASSEAIAANTAHLGLSSWGRGRLDAFIRGKDNALWHKYYDNGWSRWENLGGSLTSDPAAVSWGAGRIDVFARGANNALIHKYYSNGWSSWESLGGTLDSGPTAASWGSGRLDVFARASNGSVIHKYYSGGWSGWENLGGTILDQPAAISWGSGRIDLLVRGSDNRLFHKYYSNGWSGWQGLGGQLSSGPAVTTWGSGRLDVFARGTTGQLYHQYYSNGWSSWENLGGALSSGPAAVSSKPGRIDTLALGIDGEVYQKYYENTWSDWLRVDPVVSPSSWMVQSVDVNAYLSSLTIPGTHDSGATKDSPLVAADTAKAQTLSIKAQLELGVRFLDLRFAPFNGELQVFHGPVLQMTAEDAIGQVKAFLAAHPGETVIVSIKDESLIAAPGAFDLIVTAFIDRHQPYFYRGTTVPRYKDAMGRIVLVRRYPSSSGYGIDASSGWPSNGAGNVGSELYVTDRYEYTCALAIGSSTPPCNPDSGSTVLAEKWSSVASGLNSALNTADRRLHITFASATVYSSKGIVGTGVVPGEGAIPFFSNVINPHVRSFAERHHGRMGVVLIDRADAATLQPLFLANADHRP